MLFWHGSRVRKSWIRGYQNVCRGGGCDPGSSNWGGGVIDPHCIPVIDLSHLFENQIAWKRVNSKWNRQISFFPLHVLLHSFGRPFNENGWHQFEWQTEFFGLSGSGLVCKVVLILFLGIYNFLQVLGNRQGRLSVHRLVKSWNCWNKLRAEIYWPLQPVSTRFMPCTEPFVNGGIFYSLGRNIHALHR